MPATAASTPEACAQAFQGVPFMPESALDEARGVLARTYGYPSFRPGQEELVAAVLTGRDALGVMPTGAGKSICYQVPGIMLPGLALVVSPARLAHGRPGARAHRRGRARRVPELHAHARAAGARCMRRAREGAYKIMYVAPERLEDPALSRVRLERAGAAGGGGRGTLRLPVGPGFPSVVSGNRRVHRKAAEAPGGGRVHRHGHRESAR